MSIRDILSFIAKHPLTKNRDATAIKFLRWQAAARLQETKHVFDWIDGARLLAGRGDTGVTGNYYVGLSEYADMGFLLHYLRDDDCFVDIGANAGVYTVLASAVVGAKGIALEPIRSTFERLQDHIYLNRICGRVDAYNCGVGSADTFAHFTSNKDTMNHVVDKQDVNTEQVEIKSLDGILPDTPNIVVKIDVEGFEMEVLRGAEGLLRSGAVKAIVIEINGSGTQYGVADRELDALLRSHNYHSITYDPKARRLEKVGSYNAEGNTIYVRDFAQAQER